MVLSSFIIDLRYTALEQSNYSSTEITLRFAARIEADLGAQLNNVWGSRDDEEQGLEEVEPEYPVVPFVTEMQEFE